MAPAGWFSRKLALASIVAVAALLLVMSGRRDRPAAGGVREIRVDRRAEAAGDATVQGEIAPSDPSGPRAIDPELRARASRLHAPDASADEDLEIVAEFLALYRRGFEGNPIGTNEEITAALTGANPRGWVLFPGDHPAIRGGELVDRWGTPLWFHALSGSRMEIRSAGPDRELFTPDDRGFTH